MDIWATENAKGGRFGNNYKLWVGDGSMHVFMHTCVVQFLFCADVYLHLLNPPSGMFLLLLFKENQELTIVFTSWSSTSRYLEINRMLKSRSRKSYWCSALAGMWFKPNVCMCMLN